MPAPGRQPTFFWQALFIVLPVALMAAFGFWAILHQRRMVEQDAQSRAQEIAHGLPDDFGRLAADELGQYETAKNGWLGFEENLARWPADPLRQQTLDNTNTLGAIANNLGILRSAFADWGDDVPPVAAFVLGTNGRPAWQESPPPKPPAWVAILNPDQRAAWGALASVDLAGQPSTQLPELADALRQTDPPADTETCAQFFVLRAQLRNTPGTNAAAGLLGFANQHDEVRTDSGIRLTSLALAAILGQKPAPPPTAALWAALNVEALQNGFLAPRLLDEAADSVLHNRELSECIRAMHVSLAERQLRYELASALVHAGYQPPIPITNLWLNARCQRWLCLANPVEGEVDTIVSNRPVWTASTNLEARFFPQFLVSHAISHAFARAKVSLPDYFALTCEVAGRPLPLPAPWNRFTEIATNAPVLAEARFQMSCPAIMNGRPGHHPAQDTPIESMPSHPTLVLRVLLADQHMLYARQRELQWIFGSLIALSLVTALVGLAAARRAFNRQLQLNQQKSNFVSSVSHELRAPIASVRLMAENLERGKITGPGRQAEYFCFIVQECRRLSSLIENVLDVSRIEQGRKQYEFEPTDLRALTEATVKLMEPYATEKGVRLHFETTNLPDSSTHIELNVDGRAIQQALVNLIDNAVKHSPTSQTVTVTIEAAPGGTPVRLTVTDRGPGIPRAEQEKIFERFHRLGSELRRETQGVGIGLSIVKHVTEAHGGRVWVESEPGHGSRFIIELPANWTTNEH
jgi:signal transduction histidine kinase